MASQRFYGHQIGRGLRQSPSTGKQDCHIIDFVDSRRRVSGLFSAPSLLGIDPKLVEMGQRRLFYPPQTLILLADEEVKVDPTDSDPNATAPPDIPLPKSVSFEEYDNPWESDDDKRVSPYIKSLSLYAWVHCKMKDGLEVYILECQGKGTIRVTEVQRKSTSRGCDEGLLLMTGLDNASIWEANFTPVIDKETSNVLVGKVEREYRRRITIVQASSLAATVKGVDLYVTTRVLPGYANRGCGSHTPVLHRLF